MWESGGYYIISHINKLLSKHRYKENMNYHRLIDSRQHIVTDMRKHELSDMYSHQNTYTDSHKQSQMNRLPTTHRYRYRQK